MTCRSTKLWLLQAETLKPTAWPSEIAEHLVACAGCSKVARKIRKLENKWRDDLPIEVETASGKNDFLKKLRQRKKPTDPAVASSPELSIVTYEEPKAKKKKPRKKRYWQPVRWAAVAAAMLVSVSVIAYLLIAPGESQASSDVVDRLIDLNLQISSADAKERRRLLEEHQASLQKDVEKARLSEEELQFARELLDNCIFLAENDDPVEEVSRITDLADKIKSREEEASKKGNDKQKEHCSFQHKKVMQMGFNPIIDRIAQFKTPDGVKKPGYESFMKYDPSKQQQLHKMIEYGQSGRFQADVRKTLDSMRKKGPGHGFGGGPNPGFGGGKGSPFGPPFGGHKK